MQPGARTQEARVAVPAWGHKVGYHTTNRARLDGDTLLVCASPAPDAVQTEWVDTRVQQSKPTPRQVREGLRCSQMRLCEEGEGGTAGKATSATAGIPPALCWIVLLQDHIQAYTTLNALTLLPDSLPLRSVGACGTPRKMRPGGERTRSSGLMPGGVICTIMHTTLSLPSRSVTHSSKCCWCCSGNKGCRQHFWQHGHMSPCR